MIRGKISRKNFEEKIRGNGSRKKTFEELTFEETVFEEPTWIHG
jgi:hypothetical protein